MYINNKSSNLIKNKNPFELYSISPERNKVFEKDGSKFYKKEIEKDYNESFFTYAETSTGEDDTEKESNTCLEILIILFVLMVVLVFL